MKCKDCGTELVCPCCSHNPQALVKVDTPLAVATPRPVKAAKRGTRMHEAWYPTQTAIDTIRREYPFVDNDWLRSQHRQFIDYWIAAPGQKGVKLDWDATWRNWMRRSAERHNVSQNGTLSTVDTKVAGWMELGRD